MVNNTNLNRLENGHGSEAVVSNGIAGSIARIGPNQLVTSDPDLMKRMLNVRTKYQRSDWYHSMRFNPAKDNILSTMDDAKHTVLRSKMAAGVCIVQITHLTN
jgi:hypothetical protein